MRSVGLLLGAEIAQCGAKKGSIVALGVVDDRQLVRRGALNAKNTQTPYGMLTLAKVYGDRSPPQPRGKQSFLTLPWHIQRYKLTAKKSWSEWFICQKEGVLSI